MTKKKTSEPKQYSLTELEQAMLKTMVQQHQALLSNFVSFITLTRLGRAVTEHTKFEMASDLTSITIEEPEVEDK